MDAGSVIFSILTLVATPASSATPVQSAQQDFPGQARHMFANLAAPARGAVRTVSGYARRVQISGTGGSKVALGTTRSHVLFLRSARSVTFPVRPKVTPRLMGSAPVRVRSVKQVQGEGKARSRKSGGVSKRPGQSAEFRQSAGGALNELSGERGRFGRKIFSTQSPVDPVSPVSHFVIFTRKISGLFLSPSIKESFKAAIQEKVPGNLSNQICECRNGLKRTAGVSGRAGGQASAPEGKSPDQIADFSLFYSQYYKRQAGQGQAAGFTGRHHSSVDSRPASLLTIMSGMSGMYGVIPGTQKRNSFCSGAFKLRKSIRFLRRFPFPAALPVVAQDFHPADGSETPEPASGNTGSEISSTRRSSLDLSELRQAEAGEVVGRFTGSIDNRPYPKI